MIDYIKIKGGNSIKNECEINVADLKKKCEELGLKKNGEKYPIYRFLNMKISIFNKDTVQIEGSIHKLYNKLLGKNQGSNYDDFTRIRAIWVVRYLGDQLGMDLFKFRVANLEIGMNINMDAEKFLDHIICHRKKDVARDERYPNGGRMIEFGWSNHYLKLYDKGRQCNLDYPLMRVEIKSITYRHSKSIYGVAFVEDLFEEQPMAEMIRYLSTKVNGLMLIADHWENVTPKNQMHFMRKNSNPIEWERRRKWKSFYAEWEKCQAVIKGLQLDEYKDELLQKMMKNWNTLTSKQHVNKGTESEKGNFSTLDKVKSSSPIHLILNWVEKKLNFIIGLLRNNETLKKQHQTVLKRNNQTQSHVSQSSLLPIDGSKYWKWMTIKGKKLADWVGSRKK